MEYIKKIPVILDTDLGDDIDDNWAIAFMLNCEELDVKLINVALKGGLARAKMVAQLLKIAGRTDIPIGIGVSANKRELFNPQWGDGLDVDNYDGIIYEDGIGKAIEIIENSLETVTLVAIDPLPNIENLLDRAPNIASRVNFVGMHGSIYLGYDGNPSPCAEYNVVEYVQASKKVFSAPWKSITVTPLDTCGLVRIKGDDFEKIKQTKNPVLKYIIDLYKDWAGGYNDTQSSVLFDTVAIYLAFANDFVNLEKLNVSVNDEGFTVIDNEKGREGLWATSWKDYDGFMELLLNRLENK